MGRNIKSTKAHYVMVVSWSTILLNMIHTSSLIASHIALIILKYLFWLKSKIFQFARSRQTWSSMTGSLLFAHGTKTLVCLFTSTANWKATHQIPSRFNHTVNVALTWWLVAATSWIPLQQPIARDKRFLLRTLTPRWESIRWSCLINTFQKRRQKKWLLTIGVIVSFTFLFAVYPLWFN